MSFKRKELPERLSVDSPFEVISVRGNLLTFIEGNSLWVVRSGNDPRAWRRKLDERRNGVGPWKHMRPPADVFLREPGYFTSSRNARMEQLRRRWSKFRKGVAEADASGFRPPEGSRRREMWERGVESWRDLVRADLDDDYESSDPRLRRRVSGRYVPTARANRLPNAYYFSLRRTIREVGKLRSVADWTSQFPKGAIEFVEKHRFQSRRWHLLNLWVRVPGGRELFDDLPVLAWLMASSWNVREKPVQRPLRSFRSLVKKPRRKTLEWLGLPGGRGTIRILRRFPVGEMRPLTAHFLIRILRNESARNQLLNYDGPLNATALFVLAQEFPVTNPVLTAIASNELIGGQNSKIGALSIYLDTKRMIEGVVGERGFRKLASVRSPKRLREYHDELAENLIHRHRPPDRHPAWVGVLSPPLPPLPQMRPVDTYEALAREGKEMGHCVSSYADRIATGSYYVYAIDTGDERATLGIRKAAHGWEFAELRGPKNRNVSSALGFAVAHWLKKPVAAKPQLQWNDPLQLEFNFGMEVEPSLAPVTVLDDDLIPF